MPTQQACSKLYHIALTAPPPSPKYVLILAQHVRDRRAPWRLNDVLAAHLFNHGIRLITLHDKIEHQRARAETRALPFVPSSKFGRYRHDYEWLIPSLKFFSPSTLLTRSFQPFAYDELENYESAVSSQYSTDLQDILSALLSLWGSPPLPSFAADPEGLGYLLVHGIHRWPEDFARFIHIEPAPHNTPTTFYTRVFLHPLRFPALRALGLPDPDVNAIEQATRSALLAMPLLQALDYLHTQLLSGLCVAAPPRGLISRDKMLDPMRRQPHPVACRLTRPREALQQVLSPTFRCWLGKRISPSMTLVNLKCDSVPWANYFTQGQKGPVHAGFQTGNLLQLTFPTQKPYTLLVRSLGPHFLRSFTSALLASNQHFPSLLLATLYGLRSGHTTLCVQGIFGAGKTFSASLLLIVLSTILDVNTLLSAEPNLPLATAIENIDLLLQDASDDVRAQYGRILANHVKVSSKLDMTPLDRQASFKADSPKRCILVTQGSLLRDLCRDHPQLQSFIQSCRVAINDEAQQGGQAGFTVLAGFLSIHCLQILTGDKEQNRSGTGGEPTKEALLERLALKSVGFFNNTTALFPWEFAKDVGRALRQFQPFTTSLPTVPDVHSLLASLSSTALPPPLSPSTVHQAEGMTPTRGVTLSLILPQSLRRRSLLHTGGNPLPTSPSPRRQQRGIRAL